MVMKVYTCGFYTKKAARFTIIDAKEVLQSVKTMKSKYMK